MYVEDLLLAIKTRLNYDCTASRLSCPFDGLLDGQWYRNFICNIGAHIAAQKPLSTKQSHVILRLIAKVRYQIMHNGMATDDELDEMLSRPQFRRPLYESSNTPREVRHLGDNLLGFRFKQNDQIVDRIKTLGQPALAGWGQVFAQPVIGKPRFDWDYRIWIVPVMRHNIPAITALINEYRFDRDPITLDYLRLCRASRDQPSVIAVAHEALMAKVSDNPLLAGWITEVAEGVTL